MTLDARVFIGVSSTDFRSDELTDMLPAPLSNGSSRLVRRVATQRFPLTNLHMFESERVEASEITSQVRDVVSAVAQQKGDFAKLRKAVPFYLGVGCSYRPVFALDLDAGAVRTIADVGAFIDLDLYWEDDDLVETIPGDFYPCGVLEVSGENWAEPLRWDNAEWGRLVAPLLRKHPGKNQTVTFNTQGGYGRPHAHFSANAVRALARSETSIRIIVEPGWPLLLAVNPAEESAS